MSYMALWEKCCESLCSTASLEGILVDLCIEMFELHQGWFLKFWVDHDWALRMIAMNIYEDVYAVRSSKPLESANDRGFYVAFEKVVPPFGFRQVGLGHQCFTI
jgi:hypothetical protein